LAVETCIFPLYEVDDGRTWKINIKPRDKKPVKDYLRLQGRFRHLKEESISLIQDEVDKKWARLLKYEEVSPL